MSDQQDPGPPDRDEQDEDRDAGQSGEEDRDEAIREGTVRDNELEHAIEGDDED